MTFSQPLLQFTSEGICRTGDERVSLAGGGEGLGLRFGYVSVTRIRAPLRQHPGRRGRRHLPFKSFRSIGGVRGLTLETRTGGGQTQTPTHGEVGGGAGGG